MKEYFRAELEITYDKDSQSYKRDNLKMHWRSPLPESPWIKHGTDTITLSDHPDLEALIEQTTILAVQIGLEMAE